MSRNDKAWKAWFDSDIPEESPIPDGYNTSLDTYRKLLMIRSWCPDRVLPQARKYIAESMGTKYAEGVILDMEKMWEESTIRVPMICFLSLGSDPTNAIEALAKKKELGTEVNLIYNSTTRSSRIWINVLYMCMRENFPFFFVSSFVSV